MNRAGVIGKRFDQFPRRRGGIRLSFFALANQSRVKAIASCPLRDPALSPPAASGVQKIPRSAGPGRGIPGHSSCNCRSPVMEGCSVLRAACRYVVRLDFAVLPQLRQVFAKMEVNIPLVASKARLELSIGISAPQPPGAYDLAGPPNRSVCL